MTSSNYHLKAPLHNTTVLSLEIQHVNVRGGGTQTFVYVAFHSVCEFHSMPHCKPWNLSPNFAPREYLTFVGWMFIVALTLGKLRTGRAPLSLALQVPWWLAWWESPCPDTARLETPWTWHPEGKAAVCVGIVYSTLQTRTRCPSGPLSLTREYF